MNKKCEYCKNDKQNCKCIFMASHTDIKNISYREGIKYAVKRSPIGQRDWKMAIQDALLLADGKGYQLRDHSGNPVETPLVDDFWSRNDRYIRDFLTSEKCTQPEYDRMIDLYFKIMLKVAYAFLNNNQK